MRYHPHTRVTSSVAIMSFLWKTSDIFAVLLAVLCLGLTRVSGRKEQTNGHWSVKDSRQTVDLDNAYDIALHLQHKLLKDFKHLKNQMASMQADNAVDQDHLADQTDDSHRRLDTLDWFGRSSESQVLRSKLEDHDSYLRMMTQMFKDQFESIAERIEKNLEAQGEHLERIESRIDALNDTPVADQFAHHEELCSSQKTTDQLIKDIYDTVVVPRDCTDMKATGRNTSGIYRVFPGNVAKRMEAEVFCDMDLDENGWLVFQQRKSGNVNFERNWTDYASGFGDLTDEFWLGNDLLHALTANRKYKLRIEMEDFEGQKRFAQYANFSVRSSADHYRLVVSSYTGDAEVVTPVFGPTDCADIRNMGFATSGEYFVYPSGGGKRVQVGVYCDFKSDTKSWLVFQRRMDGSEKFDRKYAEYERGFGNRSGEFWMGNEALHLLTANRKYKLRIDMKDFKGKKRYAVYTNFTVGSSKDSYRLTIGGYFGTAGDDMRDGNNMKFTTIDVDNDPWLGGNCAQKCHGAWWYNTCHLGNLNGLYLGGKHDSFADGIVWNSWHEMYYSLKTTEMKLARLEE